MSTHTASSVFRFEVMLWKNELEYQRRELTIFESYLLNQCARIEARLYADYMQQLHGYLQLVDRLAVEITLEEQQGTPLPAGAPPSKAGSSCRYLREEMFYLEQNYRRFRSLFRSLAERMEVA